MQIHEQFKGITVFLFHDDAHPITGRIERMPVGTGFLVSVMEQDSIFAYVVTAKHIIDGCKVDSHDIFVRLNTTEGKYHDEPTDPNHWTPHHSTDIAVYGLGEIFNKLPVSLRYVPIGWCATDDIVRRKNIREGDEIFFVGMFAGHTGYDRIQPVARFGHIALMPNEKVEAETAPNQHIMIDAYLIDTVAMGGTSGSPVFIYYPPDRTGRLQSPIDVTVGNPILGEHELYSLLGVVQGYYDRRVFTNKRGDEITLNAGIGIVMPAIAIVEVLMQKSFDGRRKKLAKQNREHHDTRPRAASIDNKETPFTRDDFVRDLNKVVRKKPRPDEENSQT